MEVIYSEKAQKDREFWKKSGNKAIMNKISALIEDIQLHPYEGLGKPEQLKHQLSGRWSRRINKEHKTTTTKRKRPNERSKEKEKEKGM